MQQLNIYSNDYIYFFNLFYFVFKVDEFGFPTVEGLLRIYSDGVTDQGYYLATLQAVQHCLGSAQKKHVQKLTVGKEII